MKSKKTNVLIFIILIAILGNRLLLLNTNEAETEIKDIKYNLTNEKKPKDGILTITEKITAEKVKALLDNQYEFILYSEKLQVNDQVNVKYLIEDNIIYFQNIENYIIDKDDYYHLDYYLRKDEKLKKYVDNISFTFDFETDLSYINYLMTLFIPVKLDSEYYLTTDGEKQLKQRLDCDCDYLPWEEAKTITINIGYDFEVFNFIFIPSEDDYNKENMKQVNYDTKDKKLDFERINNHGMYELTIKYKNEDIIKIIFQ